MGERIPEEPVTQSKHTEFRQLCLPLDSMIIHLSIPTLISICPLTRITRGVNTSHLPSNHLPSGLLVLAS